MASMLLSSWLHPVGVHQIWQLSAGERSNIEMRIRELEGELTWLVYIIGAIMGSHLTPNSSEQQELIDGELACRAFRLLHITDMQVGASHELQPGQMCIQVAFGCSPLWIDI